MLETIPLLFEREVEKNPDKVAIIYERNSISYGVLNANANQLAYYLRERGVTTDKPVAICMERSIDLLITILAILKAGGAYIPLDPAHPEERLLYVLKDNNYPLLVTKAELKAKFPQYEEKLIFFDRLVQTKELTEQPLFNLCSQAKPDNLAYIIYTSGSTGKPKGVLIEHHSVINYCLWFADYSKSVSRQRIDFSSNYIFDMTVSLSVVPLMLGLTIVICSDATKKDIRSYLNYLEENRVNLIKITPSYFRTLLNEVSTKNFKLSYLNAIVLGGENLTSSICKKWLAIYPNHILFNEYGPTETTVAVSQQKVNNENIDGLGSNIPIGKLGFNINCCVLNPDNSEVVPGDIGELCIGGVCLARGYLNQLELTQQKFIQLPCNGTKARFYKTGDLCRQLPDGTLEYFGRIDFQIKIRGFRIEPGEVESCLQAHPAIKQTVVIVQENSVNEKQLIAYYILKKHQTKYNTEIFRQYLQNYLPEYMVPSAFVQVDTFPLTANGKLDQHALPVPQFMPNQYFLAPRTALHKLLAKIWSEELGVKPIGIKDNFFELGGHSLSGARIISRINNILNKEISLNEFYQAPTIEMLSCCLTKVRKLDKKNVAANEESFKTSACFPLNDFQLLFWLSTLFEPKVKTLNVVTRKRVEGRIDREAFINAFKALLNKHEALSYHLLLFRPLQLPKTNLKFKLEERNFESLSKAESELTLINSFNELINYSQWKPNEYKIIARLFFLREEEIELQICLPHIISDYASLDIIFEDLTAFYLQYKKHKNLTIELDKCYRRYLFYEREYVQSHIEQDLAFWENYLKDVDLFYFSNEVVINDMEKQKITYSTYHKITEEYLTNLQTVCAENHVSINDGLYAAVALALSQYQNNQHASHIFMNIIKSARDNQIYDNTLGCLLRLEPLKVTLGSDKTFIQLAKQVHESEIALVPYQRGPNLVKLACMKIFLKNEKTFTNYLVKLFMKLYGIIFRVLPLDRRIMSICGRLTAFRHTNGFLVNINILSNFVSHNEKPSTPLFGLKQKYIQLYQYDLINVNNVFEACFLRDEDDTPYIVISGNLQPAFREALAKQIMQIISSLSTETKLSTEAIEA